MGWQLANSRSNAVWHVKRMLMQEFTPLRNGFKPKKLIIEVWCYDKAWKKRSRFCNVNNLYIYVQSGAVLLKWNNLWQIGVKCKTGLKKKPHRLPFSLSRLVICKASYTGKLKQSHNQLTPPFHHPLTLYPPTTSYPPRGTGRWKKSISLSLLALLGVDLEELIKRHTKLSPSAIQLGFCRLESGLLL